ncbi:MAG: hypothetical protein ACJ796_10010 [Gemmatimonadaceae bacterium]
MAAVSMTTITDRVERELRIPGLASLLAERLEPSDLQSLLLDVYRRKAAKRATGDVLSDYSTNRFVRPSAIPPAHYLDWDRVALSQLPPDFEAIELSPVCPLGTTSALSGLGQGRVLTTTRNTEVVSDSTNVLALEAATRRRKSRSSAPTHLAASHRLLRTQHYDNPKLSAHFRVFSLCSAGRDRGDARFEIEAIAQHVAFYVKAARAFVGRLLPLRVTLTVLSENAALRAGAEQLLDRFRNELGEIEAAFDPDRTAGREYYRTLCFGIAARDDAGQPIHLVDGGCVDWTQKLLSDVKERLVISGVGSDRVCTMRNG